jgi:phage shock protein C
MKRLYRSEKDRMIAGVCGGMGEYFNIDSTLIRVIWVLATILTVFFPLTLAYLILALIIPKEGEATNGQKK